MPPAIAEPDCLDRVRALERLRIEATRINDVAALAPLLDDDLIYVNSVGDVYDKAEYLSAIETRKLTYEPDFDVHETESRDVDDIVILSGIMIGHARLDGEEQVFNYRCLSIWRRRFDDWKLLAWQSSSLVHKPAWRISELKRMVS
ncbi:MAG TPA: nuclear transport factor 2 family protein [Allosphingosinicella sp.]